MYKRQHSNDVTIYVMKMYNEAKYLEPPLSFRSFMRHISKHLLREVQITLMTREVEDINELEQILDIFQNIRDREMGRRPNPPVLHTNENYNRPSGTPTAYRGARGGNNNNNRCEDWRCSECHFENYPIRTTCYRCSCCPTRSTMIFISVQH